MQPPCLYRSWYTLRPLVRSLLSLVVLLGTLLAMTLPVMAQSPSANLAQNMAFGTVVRDASGGALVQSPYGLLNTGGGVAARPGGQLTLRVLVTGTPNHSVRVVGFPVPLNLVGPGGGVSVDTWTASLPGALDTGMLLPPTGGPQSIDVGATLRVAGAARAGSYSGLLSLQVYDLDSGAYSGSVAGVVSVDIGYSVIASPLQDLSFGRIVASGGASLTIAPSGATTHSGNLAVLQTPASTPAIVTVTGTPNAAVTVSLPTSITLWRSGNYLIVDGFTTNLAAGSRLDGSGVMEFRLGGTLHVANDQPTGNYLGVAVVTISYN